MFDAPALALQTTTSSFAAFKSGFFCKIRLIDLPDGMSNSMESVCGVMGHAVGERVVETVSHTPTANKDKDLRIELNMQEKL